MKVLFAVSNEEISESIVKKYQKEYKQIISYKNVYYFNAILKEIQKDKNYDRIVISEDLEAFTHTQYDQIDKFIFEKLDSISDEASNIKGNDIPIILICSDRRSKSEEMLVKLFGIGVYNAIIGSDRSVDEVCKLINRPRLKKEAKAYYKIESENVSYQSESENDVSETEIQNILAHYKRLGKNEDRYVESFNNIAAQYNDTQLRIISKFLPLNVKAVLEERSPEYQRVMSFNNKVSDTLRKPKENEKIGPSEKLLKTSKPRIQPSSVVIPTNVDMNSTKKLARRKSVVPLEIPEEPIQEIEEFDEVEKTESIAPVAETIVEPVKKKRGRPRKNLEPKEEVAETKTKRGRGRPPKNKPQEAVKFKETEETFLPMVDEEEEDNNDFVLPGFDEIEETQEPGPISKTMTYEEDDDDDDEYSAILPGFDEEPQSIGQDFYQKPARQQEVQSINQNYYRESVKQEVQPINQNYYQESQIQGIQPVNQGYVQKEEIETVDLSYLLTGDKKIVTFVGTSKNGTSFIVNNLAELLSSIGINVAILDTTRNKNSYYIYTNNEEDLREIATHSIYDLVNGIANGIKVNKSLTVYTSVPNEDDGIENADKILETLLKNHTLILIDTDFETPARYFKQSQETYLVQTLDILTIQPLTAFLRNLKAKDILDQNKLRIILNKTVRIKGISDKTIIGGMAYYNDPAMSFMTELFDRTLIKHISIPFEEETYANYLENIIECTISLKGYSKVFMQTLRDLANMVYPLTNTYTPPTVSGQRNRNTFSPNINNTLNQMKNNY